MTTLQHKTIRGPVKLGKIHSSGRCEATVENKHIYLDFGIPDEEITYILDRRKQGFRSGKAVDVIKPSPHRCAHFCIHYRHCGGCSWQHISYPFQLKLKHDILCNALTKYGITSPAIPPVIPSPEINYFRHRMEYTFARTGYKDTKAEVEHFAQPALGFHRYGEPDHIIDIQECFLQQQPSRLICEFVKAYALDQHLDFYDHIQKTGFLRSLSIRTGQSGEVLVVIGFSEDRPFARENFLSRLLQEFPAIVSLCWTIHLSDAHSQLQGEIIPFGNTGPYLYSNLGNMRFRLHATSFFQPNALQAEKIFMTVNDWAKLSGTEHVYDLYTGIGTIALFLARGAKQVTGIEGSPQAIEDAKVNAGINKIGNVDFLVGDILETFKTDFLLKHGKPDVIVLDPPRSGTLIEIKKTINASGAGKVLYLSCNPVSLAFDLKQLTEIYRITRIQPFDMLPHTQHLETLVMMERK